MAAKKFVQTNTLFLAGSGVIVTATSIILTSFTDIYGNALTLADFGDKGYGTLEPDTTNEEAFTFTSVTTNANGTVTLGGVSTALAKSPYTETSGLIRAHSGGTKLVISDNVAFWNTFGNINNTQTWADIQTYSVPPVSATDPTSSSQVANKHYVDGVAVSGAPNASTTVKGIVQEATQAQVLSKTAAGSTAAELYVNPSTMASTLLSDYKVDTGAANAYVITPAPAISAYTVGQIFSFKAVNANTTASTLNVNGLGVKTIKKLSATDLAANDILAGQIAIVEYDGTNFQLLNPVGNAPVDLISNQTISSGTKTFTVLPQSSTVPSNANDLVNKTYADTKGTLGAWTTATADGAGHQVATDGFLLVSTTSSSGITTIQLKSDSASTPTTVRAETTIAASQFGGCITPVKKGDFYLVSFAGNPSSNIVLFIPLGN